MRIHFAILRDQIPTLLEDAAGGVAGDAALIDDGNFAGIGGASHPFRMQRHGKRGVGEVGDDDALEHLARTTILRLGLGGQLLLL